MTDQISTIYGIDLGTTYSCIAHVDEFGRPTAIPNMEGSRITPSVVFFDGNNRVIGNEAKNNAQLYPNQVVEMVKRQMGQNTWTFSYDNKEYSPEEISSYILRKIVGDAEQFLGTKITDVVITCPAYFGINERESTAKAGEIAGLKVRHVINEPTAAAIAYGMHEEQDQVVLVYDLGGGTFDITMIEISKNEINVIATGGDHQLGGRNWDENVINYLAEEWKNLTGSQEEPLDDLETAQDLFLKAEQAKISLTAREKTNVAVTHAGESQRIVLTREKFDELTTGLLERTIEYTRSMLAEAARQGYSKFDRILLVGGSTRMPQVSERLKIEFPAIEIKTFDPDEAVAKGAALFGQKLAIGDAITYRMKSEGKSQAEATKEVAETLGLPAATVTRMDEMGVGVVSSHTFGVVAIDMPSRREMVSNIIRKNTRLPKETMSTFGTAASNQDNVDIRIMENSSGDDRSEVSDSQEIGKATLNLPPSLPEGAPIEITFILDDQGRLHARARDVTGNRTVEVDIQTSRIISEEKLNEAKNRSTQLTFS